MGYTTHFKRWYLLRYFNDAYIHAQRIENDQPIIRSEMPKVSSSSIGRTQFRNTLAHPRSQPSTSQALRKNPNEVWNTGKCVLASALDTFKCFKCDQPGYKSSDYPKRKFTPQVNFIKQEDDENGDAEGNEEVSYEEELDFFHTEVDGMKVDF